MLATLVVAGGIAIVGACQGTDKKEAGGTPGTVARAVDVSSCSKSSDCVVESQMDCCPCNAGGRQVAVRKKSLEAYRAARAARCSGDLLCPQVYLCDDAATAVCVAGRCEIAGGGAAAGR